MDQIDKKPAYYSSVIVISFDGKVLLGKRTEDGKWTSPGGGAEPEETNPAKTAIRELFEEAGIVTSPEFLRPVSVTECRNGKFCHTYLYVVNSNVMVTSKLDPDQEVKTWKWFDMNQIPDGLREDERRFASVRNAYMKFHGITKSLTEQLEKGGKPAQVGEMRNFGGRSFQKMANGEWKPVVHAEEKQLEQEQNKNKVVSLTDKLKAKVAEKNEISESEKHLHDLKNQVVVDGQETRSGKPMFTKLDAALAHGYDSTDFREAGSFFYERAQKMTENIAKLESTGQKVDPKFEEIKKLNLKMAKQFLNQANHVDERKAKTAMHKSSIHIGHADAAEIETGSFANEHKHSMESDWLERMYALMDGYQFGEVPRVMPLDKGDLYLVKVDDGIYSGIFKTIKNVDGGIQEDNAKVRLERMTLPTMVQFCLAKEWIETYKQEKLEPEQAERLLEVLEDPTIAMPIEPTEHPLDRKIKILELLEKLTN